MTVRSFVAKSILLGIVGCLIAQAQAIAETPGRCQSLPNIVILYSDDAGYADFGFQPCCQPDLKQLTPNIDSIANAGARFTNAYMSGCVCSPSRAGLMTGRYQQRFGYDNNLPPKTKSGLDLNETFATKRLQTIGYRTGLVGKWHLGYPEEYHPNARGFDWFYGLLQGSRRYFPIKDVSAHRVIQENGTPTPEAGYVTDRFGDAAVRYIQENKAKPFFLFVSFTAPHGPLQPRQKDSDRIKHIEQPKRRNYAGLIVSLDDNVGKILSAIAAEGLEQKTIVLFTNDNGGQTKTGANNGPLRGSKGTLFEGGVRVPWAMKWPEKITPKRVINEPVIALDIFPTLVSAAGNTIDKSWEMDGRSFLSLLSGKQKSRTPRTLYWRQHGSKGDIAIRDGHWKLVHERSTTGSSPELYDLRADVGEQVNLASTKPELVKSLQLKLKQWELQLQEPRWGPGSKSKITPNALDRQKAEPPKSEDKTNQDKME